MGSEEDVELKEVVVANKAEKSAKIHYLTDKRIHVLQGRYNRLYKDSIYMLIQSKTREKISMGCKIAITALGLVTSYVAAISGVDQVTKTYVTTSFSLASALISGWQSLVNFSSLSAKLYAGYVDYQNLCSELETCFLYFESRRPYDELISAIDKAVNKFEGTFNKPHDESIEAYSCKLFEVDKIIKTKLMENNG